jgi:serine/threonine protein kinase
MNRTCWDCRASTPVNEDRCRACGTETWPDDALAAGTVIGDRYTVTRLLGRGGFGITYAATHGMLHQQVAIKEFFPSGSTRIGTTVRPSATTGPTTYNTTRDKFLDEGHTLARYDHPGIVRVLDAINENNTTYLVMELLMGDTLETLIANNGPLPEHQVETLLVKIADTLTVLHADGILHRDIKPSNIIWHKTRGPVLIDFGSARNVISAHTKTATALVSHGYAPIEQYQTRATYGPQTDIYGLAATAYHALTATPPPSAIDRLTNDNYIPAKSDNVALADVISYGLQPLQTNRPATSELFVGKLRLAPPPKEPPVSPQTEVKKPPAENPLGPIRTVSVQREDSHAWPEAPRRQRPRRLFVAAILATVGTAVGGSLFASRDTTKNASTAGKGSEIVVVEASPAEVSTSGVAVTEVVSVPESVVVETSVVSSEPSVADGVIVSSVRGVPSEEELSRDLVDDPKDLGSLQKEYSDTPVKCYTRSSSPYATIVCGDGESQGLVMGRVSRVVVDKVPGLWVELVSPPPSTTTTTSSSVVSNVKPKSTPPPKVTKKESTIAKAATTTAAVTTSTKRTTTKKQKTITTKKPKPTKTTAVPTTELVATTASTTTPPPSADTTAGEILVAPDPAAAANATTTAPTTAAPTTAAPTTTTIRRPTTVRAA